MNRILTLRKFALSLAVFALVSLGSAALAKADSVVLNVNQGSTLPSQQYGTITLTVNGTGGIDVSINLLAGNRIVNTGFDASIAFNSTLGGQNGVSSIVPAGHYTLVNSGNPSAIGMDGFGTFEYGLLFNQQGGGAGTDSVVTFTVTRAGGFSSVNQLLENSVGGGHAAPWALDIICDSCNNGNGATGVVGTSVSSVPEPASMILLGTGLVGLATGLRRRMKK